MAPWPPWSGARGRGAVCCLRVSADPHRLPQPSLTLPASAGGWGFISILGFDSVCFQRCGYVGVSI